MRPALLLLVFFSACNLVKGPPKDHECRARLRSIIAAQSSFYSDHQRYSTHPAEVGFAPPQGNRYLYLFDRDGPITRRDGQPSPPLREAVGYGPDTKTRGAVLEELLRKLPSDVRDSLGMRGECPACEITVACVGNIDDDEGVDVWSISTADRPGIVRGTPLHHVSDLANPPPPPPPPECTLATPLVEGAPGSPGHLLPSKRNPNGDSELAALMRTFVDDWKAARATLEAQGHVAPRLPSHRLLRCAWPTDVQDRNEAFDALAQSYLAAVGAFDEGPSQPRFNAVIDACRACHEVTCGGPLEVIEGLRWK